MSVQPYSDPDKFPAAAAVIENPASLAFSGGSSNTLGQYLNVDVAQQIPRFTDEPWATLLPNADAIITASTGGNTGQFSIDSVDTPSVVVLDDDPGDGDPVAGYIQPSSRSGLNDLALRLQNGYTDSGGTDRDPIPSTIISGKIFTEASPSNPTIAPY